MGNFIMIYRQTGNRYIPTLELDSVPPAMFAQMLQDDAN